jgi:hypothetical protein
MADANIPAAVRSFLQAQEATGDNSLPAALFEEDEPTQFTLNEGDIRYDSTGKVIARGGARRESEAVTPAQRSAAERWKFDRLQELEQEVTEGQTGEQPAMAADVLERRKLEIENAYRRQIGLPALTALPDSWKTGGAPARAPQATGRTASRADVQAVAQKLGVSVDEAQRQLEARGVKVR